ncbi:TolC family outer membrane protein [Oceaniglobus indicus]|uniref:TolC family outer membrane protein n=1 Tax=Oceaniglobus indicus TaxID=2047749 RepID=UPI001F4E402C|nr:TolC family outer membrane protein [Oceaniglobus indicus]
MKSFTVAKTLGRVALMATLVVGAAQLRAESLTDAFIAAYKHNGLLEQNRATLRAADEDVAQAVALLRPVINYAAGISSRYPQQSVDELTASLELSAELLLFDFGATRLGIDAAKETVLATREALIAAEQTVLLNTVQAYMAVRRDAAFVNLRQSNNRLIDRELKAARDRFEVGEVTRTDVAIAESRLAGAQSGLAAARGNLAQSREFYRRVVGSYPENLAPPPTPPQTAKSLEAAIAVARRTHPDIRQAMRLVTVADIGIARAEAAMRPTVRARASIGLDQGLNDSRSLGVTLSGPIYQGGALSSAYRQAQARRDRSRATLHLTQHQVEEAVGNAWALIAVSRASLSASDEQVRAATVAFRGVQEEATLGARTTLDVLDAEQELLDARTTRISADTDRYTAIYSLLATMGLLTVEHLGLGIVTYDPAAYYNAVRTAPTHKVSPQGKKLDRILRGLGKQ